MTRIPLVLDANIILSALLFPQSVPDQALSRAMRLGRVLVSLPLLEEVTATLYRKKFDRYFSLAERMEFLDGLLDQVVWHTPHLSISTCRDPADDKILELAVSADAACIVSGDHDLLVLSPLQGIPILSPRDFLAFPI